MFCIVCVKKKKLEQERYIYSTFHNCIQKPILFYNANNFEIKLKN